DVTGLTQVVLNLCVNARDAMPQGGDLTIRLENRQDPALAGRIGLSAETDRFVVLSVIDSGQGIAPEVMDKIFDPFFTTKELGKGTGLGLATSIGIVKSHGGTMTVESEFGKGSNFTIILPASNEALPAKAEFSATVRSGQGERVLVVDDETSL